MAYRRSYTKRRPTYRRNRTTRRNMKLKNNVPNNKITPAPMKLYKKIRSMDRAHAFVRTAQYDSLLLQEDSAAFGSIGFTFSQIPLSTEFTTLFDQYIIDRVSVKFVPNKSDNQVGSTSDMGIFYLVTDYDDLNSPTSVDQMLQYADCRIIRPLYSFTKKIVPKVTQALYGGGVFSSYGSSRSWVDVASNNVQHYGMKYWWESSYGTPPNTRIDVFVTYYFRCKGLR